MCALLSGSCGLLCLIVAMGLQTLVSSGRAGQARECATGRITGVFLCVVLDAPDGDGDKTVH